MVDEQLQNALNKFRMMDSKMLNEAAHTYLLGVLEMGLPEEIEETWRSSFEKESDHSEADLLLRSVINKNESDALLRIAVEATLASRPDTKELFIESVESAGEKQWALEVALVALAAATVIKELYRKGKKREVSITEMTDVDGNKIATRTEIQYASDGPLAVFLAKIAHL